MPKPSRLEFWLISAIAVGIILRIINLDSREFWYDEVLSLLLVTGQKSAYQAPQDVPVVIANYTPLLSLPSEQGLHDTLKTIANLLRGLVTEPHPPLFFLGQQFWLRLWGNTEAAMRSLGVIYSIGAIACAYGFGRHLLGHRGGLIFAALLGVNDYYLFHSLNVRMYCPLVFWVILSAWALLELSQINQDKRAKILWSIILTVAIMGGFMTFYLFIYYVITLAGLGLWLNKKYWWQVLACLGLGILLTTPWLWWGTRQQLRNADFERFGSTTGFLETSWRHLDDILQTLGIHLILGDWISSLPIYSATIAGVIALAVLIGCSLSLWQKQETQLLTIALILMIVPLVIALFVDLIKNQFTLGFGWGRPLIFILPGCLLLLTVGLTKVTEKWQQPTAIALLSFYLIISIADFSLRPRWMFHQLADIIQQEANTPTLIAMNSRAWGHVLRLAYYLPRDAPISLLAQNPANLAPTLKQTLDVATATYPRLIWLDSTRPVWGTPKTEAEKQQFQSQIQSILNQQYQLDQTAQLSGTMELDQFAVSVYHPK